MGWWVPVSGDPEVLICQGTWWFHRDRLLQEELVWEITPLQMSPSNVNSERAGLYFLSVLTSTGTGRCWLSNHGMNHFSFAQGFNELLIFHNL